MYRRVLLSALSSVALVSPAFAADIYTPTAPAYAAVALPPSWAGFYLGVNGGYGGNSGLGFNNNIYDSTVAAPYAAVNGTSIITGGFGGGQLGYNWQWGPLVAGFETDIEGSNIAGVGAQAYFTAPASLGSFCGFSGAAGNTSLPCAARNDLNVDYFGTVRARLGYAFGGTLLYATGGFAYGGVNSSSAYEDSRLAGGPVTGRVSSSTTATGWAAGAGIEYKIAPSWTLKGEYQFVDLGSVSTGSEPAVQGGILTCTPAAAGVKDCLTQRGHSDVSFNTVRIGVNYLFNTPEPLPLK